MEKKATGEKRETFQEFIGDTKPLSNEESWIAALADYFLKYFDTFNQMASETGISEAEINAMFSFKLKFIDKVRYQEVMEKNEQNKVIQIADYIILTGASTRKAALEFGISNATVSDRMNNKLPLIDNDRYMITASAYCHNNPVRARMCKYPDEYEWSSMRTYMGYEDCYNIVHTDFILRMLSETKSAAMRSYAKIMEREDRLNIGQEMDRFKYESSDKYYISRKYNTKEVFKKVAEYFKSSMYEVMSKYNKKHTLKRQFAQYVLSIVCSMSNNKISRYFNTSPSNIRQNLIRLMNRLKEDINLQYELDNLCKCFV
jgi:hypothetical protein